MKNWNGKPYYSFDYMLKERFSEKIYKVALNGRMTCPNRDGTLGNRGCIFCSAGGSGDFAGDKQDSITTQIEKQAARLRMKRNASSFIAYFQAYTNTYAPVSYTNLDVYKRQFIYCFSYQSFHICFPPPL